LEFFLSEVSQSRNQPKHIAIIMDGNGRWAKKRFYLVLLAINRALKL